MKKKQRREQKEKQRAGRHESMEIKRKAKNLIEV